MADADTGYGNAVNAYHTVQYFEEAGIVGINIEDQLSPKRCGHMAGKELIDAREMGKKNRGCGKGEAGSGLHRQRAHRSALSRHVPAALGTQLVLDVDADDPPLLEVLHRVVRVDGIAVARIRVRHQWDRDTAGQVPARVPHGAVFRGSGDRRHQHRGPVIQALRAYAGKRLIEADEMGKKIEAAVKAKRDPDFIVNARTDAIAVEGIEGAIERLKIYAASGADMIYPDAVRGEDDIRRVVDALPGVPLNIGMGFGIRSRPTTPLISLNRLKEIGVARVGTPRLLSAAALSGMTKALAQLRECMATGEAADRPDLLVGMEEITQLVGYERIARLEQAFLLDEQLEHKYGAGERDYVIRPPGKS